LEPDGNSKHLRWWEGGNKLKKLKLKMNFLQLCFLVPAKKYDIFNIGGRGGSPGEYLE